MKSQTIRSSVIEEMSELYIFHPKDDLTPVSQATDWRIEPAPVHWICIAVASTAFRNGLPVCG